MRTRQKSPNAELTIYSLIRPIDWVANRIIMAQIAGVIRVNEGIVLGADSLSLRIDSNIVKLNDKIAALCVDDFVAGASFCCELAKTASGKAFDDVIADAKKVLETNPEKYVGKILTLIFVGYDEQEAEKPFYIIKFDGQKIANASFLPFNLDIAFSVDESLARHIAQKVLTRSMPLDKSVRLMAYILLQYNQILRTGRKISIATLSDNGFKSFNAEEINQVVSETEQIDSNIKRKAYDIFVRNTNRRQ